MLSRGHEGKAASPGDTINFSPALNGETITLGAAMGQIAIGKSLTDYDAIDTGLFVCSPEIFGYLEQAKRDGDCSLADGVRLMAADGKVRVIDIGDAWWQDIDSPETLEHARKSIATKRAL